MDRQFNTIDARIGVLFIENRRYFNRHFTPMTNFRTIAFFFLFANLTAFVSADEKKAPAGDLKELQGTWQATEVTSDGQKGPNDRAKEFQIVIRGDMFSRDGDETMAGKITIDPSTSPKQMDVVFDRGPKKGNMLAIFSIEDGKLKLCISNFPNGKRPTEFLSKSGEILLVMERLKPRVEEPRKKLPGEPDPGEVRKDNTLKMKLGFCPSGKFTMGSPNTENRGLGYTETQVEVTLTKGFYIGVYSVTQAEWKSVMNTSPWKKYEKVLKEGDQYPATAMRWSESMEFCKKFTESERQAGCLSKDCVYTLPTEAQREYACRAGSPYAYCFGGNPELLSEYAWYKDENIDPAKFEDYPHEVGRKKPNAWGLYDMHGNIVEWCRDGYRNKLVGGDDPVQAIDESLKTFRGGSAVAEAWGCRSAFRVPQPIEVSPSFAGFRIVLVHADK